MSILEFIAFVLVFGGAMYFAWRDGFEQGVSAGNRRQVKRWGNVMGQLRRHGETLTGLDNRIDGIEAQLNTAKKLLKFASNNVYGCKNIDTNFANDGDMSHLQCRYCNEGSCYVKKEGKHIVVVGELPNGAADCEVVREAPDANTDSN